MRFARLAAIVTGTAALSCNNPYDLLIHDRFEQADFNGTVDILWVVDNSNSMEPDQERLRQSFEAFITQFANLDQGDGEEFPYETITHATVAWAEFLQNQERFLNFNMGVTTTDITSDGNGQAGNIRSTGGIGGGGCEEPSILTPDDPDLVEEFQDLVTVGVDGSGDETGLLAAAFALCKGMDGDFWAGLGDRPDTDPVKAICELVPASDRAAPGSPPPCNAGFYRDGAANVVIVVTDEGDFASTRNDLPGQTAVQDCVDAHAGDPTFGECDCRLEFFMEFFEGIGRPVVFATIAPSYQLKGQPIAWCDGGELDIPGPCNGFGSPTCAVDFYQQAACMTGGLYTPNEVNVGGTSQDDPPQCEPANFEEALTNIGALISNLSRGWKLSVIPDTDTITVLVDGEAIKPQTESPSGGWRYLPTENAIGFSGEALPGYNAVVDIYYLPLHERGSQTGRELPF